MWPNPASRGGPEMPGDVEILDVARRAHHAASPFGPAAAADYVRRAEDALALLPSLDDVTARAAVCGIVETWLTLAETEIGRADLRR